MFKQLIGSKKTGDQVTERKTKLSWENILKDVWVAQCFVWIILVFQHKCIFVVKRTLCCKNIDISFLCVEKEMERFRQQWIQEKNNEGSCLKEGLNPSLSSIPYLFYDLNNSLHLSESYILSHHILPLI